MTSATSTHGGQLTHGDADEYTQIVQAKQTVEQAYVQARRLVYDHYPSEPVDLAQLDGLQVAALQFLDEAERDLDRLRQARRERRRPVLAGQRL